MRDVLRRLRRDERGITLSEMLVVIVLIGILTAAFAGLLSSSITHSTTVEQQSDIQVQMRGALEPLVREFRQAHSGTSSSPVESIAVSGTPQITFTTPDRGCTGPTCGFFLRRVSYRLSGGNFQRAFYTSTNNTGAPWTWPAGSPSNWVTLVSGVTTTTPFSFLDAAGRATTTAANVRTVGATLTKAPTANAGRAVTYEVSTSLRTTAQ